MFQSWSSETSRLYRANSILLCTIGLFALSSGTARAQAGPPFLTNDPGTPGNANWEINLGSMQTIARGVSSYQVPQIDLNFGVGDRIQLTYEGRSAAVHRLRRRSVPIEQLRTHVYPMSV